jgi:DNA gyrase/topoisomerase IV subunit A
VSWDEPSRELLEARIAILGAYLLAAGRRQEVIDIAARSETPEDARQAVARLLDVSEDAAWPVLELRILRFTKAEQATFRVERDSTRGRLDRGL